MRCNSSFKQVLLGLLVVLLSACAQDAIKPQSETTPAKPVVVLSAADKTAYGKALGLIKAKKYDQATTILDQLIQKYPAAAGPLANRGIIAGRLKQYDKAEEYFSKALKNNEKLVQARNHLAVIYRIQGKFKQARDMLEAAVATDPYYANAYYNLGILYELYLQQPEKALQNYQLYLDIKEGGDKEVSQWVSLLQRQLKAGK